MMEKKNNSAKILHSLICSIMGIFLTLFISAFIVLIVSRLLLFSKASFYKNIISFDYSSYVTEEFYNNAESITLPTGIPFDVFNNVINNNRIYEDIYGYVDAIFDGREYTPDTSEWEAKLKENILSYLDSQQYTVTQDDEKNINDYITSIREEYCKRTQIPLFQYYVKVKVIFDKIFMAAVLGTVLGIACISFFIIKMNRWFHRGLRYIAHSMLGTVIMVTALPAFCLISGIYKRINLTPQYFYNFVMMLLTRYLQSFLFSGLILFVLWVAAVITCEKLRK